MSAATAASPVALGRRSEDPVGILRSGRLSSDLLLVDKHSEQPPTPRQRTSSYSKQKRKALRSSSPHTAVTAATSGSAEGMQPRRQASPSAELVERRLQAARALYQAENLLLEEKEPFPVRQRPTLQTQVATSQHPPSPLHTITLKTPRAKGSSSSSFRRSQTPDGRRRSRPSLSATAAAATHRQSVSERISPRSHLLLDDGDLPPPSEDTSPNNSTVVSGLTLKTNESQPTITAAPPKESPFRSGRRRAKTPDAKRSRSRSSRRAKRSQTPDARSGATTQNNNNTSANQSIASASLSSKKSGTFFRKIFGKKKKHSSNQSTAASTVVSRTSAGARNASATTEANHSNNHNNNDMDTITSELTGPPAHTTPALTDVAPPPPPTAAPPPTSTTNSDVFFSHDDVSTLTSPTWESKQQQHLRGAAATATLKELVSIPSYEKMFSPKMPRDPFDHTLDSSMLFAEPDGVSPKSRRNQFPPQEPEAIEAGLHGPLLGQQPQPPQPTMEHPIDEEEANHDPPLFLQSLVDEESEEERAVGIELTTTDLPEGYFYVHDQDAAAVMEEKKEEDFFAAPQQMIPPPPPSEPKKRRNKSKTPKARRHKSVSPRKAPKVLSPANTTATNVADAVHTTMDRKPAAHAFANSENRDAASVNTTTLHDSDTGEAVGLTVAGAARLNALSVAYLHQVNGDPSPRRTWRQNPMTLDEEDDVGDMPPAVVGNTSPQISPTSTLSSSTGLFSAYSGKFKGRKKSAQQKQQQQQDVSQLYTARRPQKPAPKVAAWKVNKPMVRNVSVTNTSVSKGFAMYRERREEAIASGHAKRVIPKPKKKKVPKVRSYYAPHHEPEPTDPIQRAGRRLLAKSAVPIQAAARAYLAQQEAIDRMWGLIELQSYARRWRAQAHRKASISSAVSIQSTFRAWRARRQVDDLHHAATQVQRVVRGYLASATTFDAVYRVILVQARARGNLVRQEQAMAYVSAVAIQAAYRGALTRTDLSMQIYCATMIQSYWRWHVAAKQYREILAARTIQTCWRGHTVARDYQAYCAVRAIQTSWRRHYCAVAYSDYCSARTVQSAWRKHRCWSQFTEFVAARRIQSSWRKHRCLSEFTEYLAARQIQSSWRKHLCQSRYDEYLAARRIQSAWSRYKRASEYEREVSSVKIQAVWRGFQCYTDYIFALVDIMVLQRTFRRHMAQKRVEGMRRDLAAVKIQSSWRRAICQTHLLYDFVHLILSQAVARRFLCRNILNEKRAERSFREQQATKIQSAWRGFWGYSHFVIVQYETVRLQAITRGNITRQRLHLQLGCCIMIQAVVRRSLAINKARRVQVRNAYINAATMSLREKLSCQRIQFWWRVVMDCRKEKKSALIIERFFIMVREEVEREAKRVQMKKQLKKEKRRRKKKAAQERLHEKVWLNAVDEEHVEVFAMSESMLSPTSTVATATPSSKFSTASSRYSFGTGAASRHPARAASPKNIENYSLADTASEISGVSGVSLGFNRAQMRKTGFPESKIEEDSALEDVFRELGDGPTDKAANGGVKQRPPSSANKYMKKYGLKTGGQSRPTRGEQNVSEDVESVLSAASNLVSRNRSSKHAGLLSSRSESVLPPSRLKTPTNVAAAYRTNGTTPRSSASPRTQSSLSRQSPAVKKSVGLRDQKYAKASQELDKAFGSPTEFGMI